MWMTNRQEQEALKEPAAELGQVTLSGAGTGVALAGERRNITLCGPGGYHWAPVQGDTVLVVKSGPEQAPCITGVAEETEAMALEPGEVCLSAALGSGLHLRPDGTILLEGPVQLTGTLAIQGTLTVNGREV